MRSLRGGYRALNAKHWQAGQADTKWCVHRPAKKGSSYVEHLQGRPDAPHAAAHLERHRVSRRLSPGLRGIGGLRANAGRFRGETLLSTGYRCHRYHCRSQISSKPHHPARLALFRKDGHTAGGRLRMDAAKSAGRTSFDYRERSRSRNLCLPQRHRNRSRSGNRTRDCSPIRHLCLLRRLEYRCQRPAGLDLQCHHRQKSIKSEGFRQTISPSIPPFCKMSVRCSLPEQSIHAAPPNEKLTAARSSSPNSTDESRYFYC